MERRRRYTPEVRSLATRWLPRGLLASLLVVAVGCTSPARIADASDVVRKPVGTVPLTTVSLPRAAEALDLAARLPAGGDRCTVAQPMVLSRERWQLAALVSQSERLPWALDFAVLAYARAERAVSPGSRAVVELLRFAALPRERVMRELARALDRPIAWQRDARQVDAWQADAGHAELGRAPPHLVAGCAGELTCTTLHGEFLAPDTVLLTHGDWGVEAGPPSACVTMLRQVPGALEVSARAALLSGTELRDSAAYLELRDDGGEDGLARVTWKRYAEAESAERALREALRGRDELPTLAGVPATSLGARRDDTLVQTAFASFADLSLAADDQLRRSTAARDRAAPSLREVDAHDVEAVRTVFDAELARLRRGAHDTDTLARLTALLERACALSPDDDGLARRHYQLQLVLQNDAQAALAIALAALTRGLGDASGWRLAKRAALARFDEPGLRAALLREHRLSAPLASRMARELSERVRAGQDYERAEWAFSTARKLASAAQNTVTVPIALRVPVLELARLFAYLGQSRAPREDLGVHVLAYGATALPAAAPNEGSLWVAETSGGKRAGAVLAATSWDDAQLRALGGALAERLEDGPVDLVLGLETVGASAHTGRHVTLVLSGRRRGSELLIEQLSRPLSTLPWPTLQRLLIAPLAGMTSATFPPDELSLQALDEQEAAQLARAAEREPSIKCAREGLTVRCGGAPSDGSAARRALLAILHERLADAARALWSGTD